MDKWNKYWQCFVAYDVPSKNEKNLKEKIIQLKKDAVRYFFQKEMQMAHKHMEKYSYN